MNDLVDGESFLIFLFMHPDMIEGIEEIGRTFTEIVQSYLWVRRILHSISTVQLSFFGTRNKTALVFYSVHSFLISFWTSDATNIKPPVISENFSYSLIPTHGFFRG